MVIQTFSVNSLQKDDMTELLDNLRGFTDCLPGAKVKGLVYGEGVYQKGEVMETRAIKEAFEFGKHA